MRTFQKALHGNDFVVTAELPLRPLTTVRAVRGQLASLRHVVDAVQLGDNRLAEGHMDVLAAASIALDEGVDPVVHLTCRDRNRIALRGSLLGAAGLGVTSLVLSRGQKLPDALRGKMKGVLDTRATQLIELARRIGDDPKYVRPPGFLVGTVMSVTRPKRDWKAPQVMDKISAGAKFLQTRPCLNVKLLRAYLERLVALRLTHRASVIVEAPLLRSVQMARTLTDRVPGARIPDRLVARLAQARNPAATGTAILADVLAELPTIPGVAGVNILFDGAADQVVAAVKAAGLAAR